MPGLVADATFARLRQRCVNAGNETLPDWDSLRHMELMLALELEFGVQITSEAMTALLSLDAIDAYLREQGVPAAA